MHRIVSFFLSLLIHSFTYSFAFISTFKELHHHHHHHGRLWNILRGSGRSCWRSHLWRLWHYEWYCHWCRHVLSSLCGTYFYLLPFALLDSCDRSFVNEQSLGDLSVDWLFETRIPTRQLPFALSAFILSIRFDSIQLNWIGCVACWHWMRRTL